jgi:IS30 family transposase
MCHNNSIINSKKFKHINFQERILIEHLFNKQKKNISQISNELKRNKSSISREIKLGLVELLNSDYSKRVEYSAELAQKRRNEKSSKKGAKLKIGKEQKIADYIDKKISEKYSPEVIAYKIKQKEEFKLKIHWKTIYNYIDKGILISERKDLTYGKYKKRKKQKKEEKLRITLSKEGRKIEDRPKEVELREEVGHWEMDLVLGKRKQGKCLLVLSERKTRKEIIELIENKKSETIIKAINRIERREGVKRFREKFKTITTDNGIEFRNYKGIERSYTGSKKKRTKQYYATAYCSWQRGTNENINKMIRRFIPKGQSIGKLSQKEIKEIEKWINEYPRKMFGYKSAKEKYEEEIKKAKKIN